MKQSFMILSSVIAVMVTGSHAFANEPYCREYTKSVTIGGNEEEVYGTACRQADGTWEIVSQQQEPKFSLDSITPRKRHSHKRRYEHISPPLITTSHLPLFQLYFVSGRHHRDYWRKFYRSHRWDRDYHHSRKKYKRKYRHRHY